MVLRHSYRIFLRDTTDTTETTETINAMQDAGASSKIDYFLEDFTFCCLSHSRELEIIYEYTN